MKRIKLKTINFRNKLPEKMKDELDDAELGNFRGWWRFKIMHQCPRCKGEIWEVGYYSLDYGQRYKCANRECNWGW